MHCKYLKAIELERQGRFEDAKKIVSKLVLRLNKIEVQRLKDKITLKEFNDNGRKVKYRNSDDPLLKDDISSLPCDFKDSQDDDSHTQHEIFLGYLEKSKKYLEGEMELDLEKSTKANLEKYYDFVLLMGALVRERLALHAHQKWRKKQNRLIICNKSAYFKKWIRSNAVCEGILKKKNKIGNGQTTREFYFVPPLLIYFSNVSNQSYIVMC